MKDFSEQIEKELVGDWAGQKPMPDRIYFTKVFKRNLWVIAATLTIAGLGAAFAPLWVSDTYRSSVYVVFDHQDSSQPDPSGTNAISRFATVSRMFKARFEAQDFMKQVGDQLGPLPEKKDPLSRIPFLNLKSERGPRALMKQYEAVPEADTGILSLKAYAATPEQAQLMANVGMETFINRELDEQIKSLEIRLALLKKNVGPIQSPKVTPAPYVEKSPAKRAEKLNNEDKERELDERLRGLNAQVDQVRRERDGVLTNLKRELVKLQTNFQSNHPQVVEKRKEIELVTNQYRVSEDKINAQANGVRGQLRAVRASQSKTVDPTTLDISTAPDYQGTFFTNLSDRIKETELERQNLIQQKRDPGKRTRLQILYPASLEPAPFKGAVRMTQYGFLIGGVFLTFLLVFLREWQTPLARDAWLIERITGKKIVSQISHKNTHEYTNITPALADKMRTHLGRIHRMDEAARTLLSYRRVELAIMQQCKGDVVLLINAGSQDISSQVIKNFLNIYATDHQDDYLLIDCNMQEPIYQFDGSARSPVNLINFLNGTATFEDVCINREQMADFSFDVIPPMETLTGNNTRIFRADKIQTAIESIPFKYKKIFIRGMPAANFIENRALLAAASDVFIFVDAKRTHYFDLQRTLIHLESDKIRGLVAVGT
ncbi:MAG: hypothetical protein H7249_10475 [Chitinophagaceae bacterium]|nr:hypothetical protein [Oligoflexus sp.]